MNGWLPHAVCLLGDPWLIGSNMLGDGSIALAYFVMPYYLWRARAKIEDALGRTVFLCFAAFILLCGLTHVFDIVVLWLPEFYWPQAANKLATGAVSMGVAVFVRRIARTIE